MRPASRLHPLRAASVIGIAALLVTLVATPAAATPTPDPTPTISSITQHVLTRTDFVYPPSDMIAGSDGNIWFDYEGPDVGGLARVTPAGAVTYFDLPDSYEVRSLVLGDNGNIWFIDTSNQGPSNVGQITPSGTISEYALPSSVGSASLTQGSNGYLWLANWANPGPGAILRVSATGTVTEFLLPGQQSPGGLTRGSDGNIWFTSLNYASIGTITDSGTITMYPLPNGELAGTEAVLGADGNMWFAATDSDGSAAIYKATTSGVVSGFSYAAGDHDITVFAGPGNSVWFIDNPWDDNNTAKVVRVSTNGSFTTMYAVSADRYLADPAVGPNNNVWFTSATQTSGISKFVSVSPSGVVNTINAVAPATYISSLGFTTAGQLWFAGRDETGETDVVGSVDLAKVTSSRTAGADRYAVGVQISQQAYPSATSIPVVYVATGANYPDALSAGAPAAMQGGPLLLTPKESLPNSVKTEIQRLNPAKIVVVGGVNSVSPTVFNQLTALQHNTIRLAGADRYEASRNIVNYAFGTTGADTVYISTGANFPDALSAGAAGGAHNTPVLLVNGTASSLDAATTALLHKLNVKHIKIAGGPNSVTPALQTALNKIAPTIRLSGADRFVASQSINEDAYTSATRVFLATGFNFPDALAGSAWAGTLDAPLYVVPGSCVPQKIIDDIIHLGATKVTLIGGTASLTQNVQNLQTCP